MDFTSNDWQTNTMASALQDNHNELVADEAGSHITLSRMFKDSQSSADRKAVQESKDADAETPLSMEEKMKHKKKTKGSPLDDIDYKWLIAGLALAYFMRR